MSFPIKGTGPGADDQVSDSIAVETEDRRVFYGDMAICSKILSLAAEPLAEVVMTFFEDV